MRRHWLVLLTTLFLAACVSSPARDLASVQPGMDKDEVLELAGNPTRTFRANKQDHWVYVFYRGEQEVQQQIDFADGRVLKIFDPLAKAALTRDLESAETMEEYEAKVRARQKKGK